ncbi:hypothetical protein QSJ18_00490 [Gordonia sp. ABSL1-1]|uniref:hypothetical protein n=1 Tax=Gordonia sp. ABSL1-1 TaxID=3053923 RepID=UPI00257421CF|nr:hypothetical protein [Gordonia sp. ABSL1-1]MDL9935214.1 hypothetical protein [Gordonia sp. ABSL1-1]
MKMAAGYLVVLVAAFGIAFGAGYAGGPDTEPAPHPEMSHTTDVPAPVSETSHDHHEG